MGSETRIFRQRQAAGNAGLQGSSSRCLFQKLSWDASLHVEWSDLASEPRALIRIVDISMITASSDTTDSIVVPVIIMIIVGSRNDMEPPTASIRCEQ